MPKTIKVAAIQAPTLPTTAQTLSALSSYASAAAAQSVSLALFPEAYLGGYPRSCTFGSAIGAREEIGREQYLHYVESAVDLGDTVAGDGWKEGMGDGTREELERIARETRVFLVVGLIERAGSTLFCSVVFVDPERGMLREKRRKVMPTGTERLVWAQGNTSSLKAVTVSIGGVKVTLGSAICWENYMPLLRYSLYAQGVNIWLAPTADGRDTWLPLLQTIAQEGRCFVVSSNQMVRRSELPGWVAGKQGKAPKTRNAQPDAESEGAAASGGTYKRRNMSFCKTETGHEICLGKVNGTRNEDSAASPTRSVSPGTVRSRRSVDGQEGQSSITQKTRLRRESSAIPIADGHEICFFKSNDSTGNAQVENDIAIAPSEAGEDTIPEEDPIVSRGGSCIVSPFGKVLAQPLWEEAGMVVYDCDIDECVKGKLDFDVAGHYSRGDAFKLTVDGLDLCPP